MAISRWWADFFRINEQTGESVSNDSCFGCAGIRRRCGGKRVRQGIGWAEKHTEEDLILSATGRYTRLQVCTETLKCFLKMTIGFHILSDGPRKNGLMQRNCKNYTWLSYKKYYSLPWSFLHFFTAVCRYLLFDHVRSALTYTCKCK